MRRIKHHQASKETRFRIEMIENYFSTAKAFSRTDLSNFLNISERQLDEFLRTNLRKTFRSLRKAAINRCIEEFDCIRDVSKRLGFSKPANLRRFLKNCKK
jgi:AraC-like DNA-binding protein